MSLRLILYKFAFFVLLIDSTLVTTAHCSKLLNFMLLSLFPLQKKNFLTTAHRFEIIISCCFSLLPFQKKKAQPQLSSSNILEVTKGKGALGKNN